MVRRKADDGQSGGKVTRLVVRCSFLALPPVVAFFLGLNGYQLGFCAWATTVWGGLEAAIVFRTGLSMGCNRLPFVLRLIGSSVLDVQVAWLLSLQSGDSPPAEPAGPAAVLSAAAAGDERLPAVPDDGGAPALRGSGSAQLGLEDGHIPGQDAWWLKEEELPPPPSQSLATISVVLPCANETDFVINTVRSVFETTPAEELIEILVVDDASKPSIHRLISESDLVDLKTRILRHDIAEGLIRSKKHGGDVSRGDVIIFLDCHVKPAQGWTKQIMSMLRENTKRVVVPAITSLNPDTWEEISPYGGASKMCMTWDADFQWCTGYPGIYVPIMSGGLLAISRYWWDQIGGYDEDMHAWGGENLDQSLRTWLCGGEIVAAQESRVAHMWRDANNPKTRLHYSIPTNDVRRNRLRAVQGWFGPWNDKVLGFPQFDDFREGRLHVGSTESYEYYQKKLKCRPFEYYLHLFRDYYEGAGVLPERVFNIREKSSGLCLHATVSNKGKPDKFVLQPCNAVSEQQRMHFANMIHKSHGQCCSGIKLWEFNACMTTHKLKTDVAATMCDQFGGNHGQFFTVKDGQLRWKNGAGCVVPREANAQEKLRARARANHSAHQNDVVKLGLCATSPDGKAAGLGQAFVQRERRTSDGSVRLVAEGTGLCLGANTVRKETQLALEPCAGDDGFDDDVRWVLTQHGEKWELKNVGLSLCVDTGSGRIPILYPCYPSGTNPKQLFLMRDNGWIEIPRIWNDNGRNRWPAKCFDAAPAEPVELTAEHCGKAEEAGVQWELAYEEVPFETKLWHERKGGF